MHNFCLQGRFFVVLIILIVFIRVFGDKQDKEDWSEKIPNYGTAEETENNFNGVKVQLNSGNEKDECPICLEPLNQDGPLKGTNVCNHVFHSECLENSLKRDGKCPVCRAVIVKKMGPCPKGDMFVKTVPQLHCEGHNDCGTIKIRYYVPSGIQGSEHPNPGVQFSGTNREAYLPDNIEGRNVLELLKKAWKMRKTFKVGTSLTTGQSDVVAWNDIHHKTSTSRGPYGYPDAGYLQRVTLDMNAMGISLDE